MLIDWFTVVAQIVNFLVLMALLKVFLYDRVIRAMDEREERIASRLEEAEKKRRKAEAHQEEVAAREREIDRERDRLLEEAQEAARSKREELEENARAEVDDLRGRWTEALDREKDAFAERLRRLAAREVFSVSRRVLKDMADEDLRERVLEAFADRIREMDEEERRGLTEALDRESPAAEVLAGQEIASSQRGKLTRLLHEKIHPDLDVDYRTDEGLGAGIELRAGGRKVSWSLGHYLDELEEKVLQVLQEPARSGQTAARPGENSDPGKETDEQ